MKAQVEFVILLVLVVLVILVIGLVLQAGLAPPGGVGEQQKIVKDSVTNLIRKGGSEALRLMELQGGYLNPPDGSLSFAGTGVAYWQRCQNTNIPSGPQIKEELEKGLEDYIKNNIESLEKSYAGLDVELGQPRISTNILSNRIDFTVNMPTQVRGFDIPQPYVVSIPTRFGEIYDFATNFADSSSRERYFDKFTKISLYLARSLPTIGTLTSCGERIFLGENKIERELENLIVYTLSHTALWERVSQNIEPAAYSIETINSKKFPNLDVRFILPNNFDITANGPINLINKEKLYSGFPLPIPICVSTYHVKYDLAYPIIVNIKDELTGYSFNFAILVYLDDSEPAACGQTIPIETGERVCDSLACTAKITVRDSQGPVAGASASFGDCEIGVSNANGVIEGPIQCGVRELNIYYNDNYGFLSETLSHNEISKTYALHRKPNLNLTLNEVGIRKDGLDALGNAVSCTDNVCSSSCGIIRTTRITCTPTPTENTVFLTFSDSNTEYTINNINPESVSPGCEQGDNQTCSYSDTADSVYIPSGDSVPAGTYNVTASVIASNQQGFTAGFKTAYNLGEEDKNLMINALRTESVGEITTEIGECLAKVLVNECGMQPIEDI